MSSSQAPSILDNCVDQKTKAKSDFDEYDKAFNPLRDLLTGYERHKTQNEAHKRNAAKINKSLALFCVTLERIGKGGFDPEFKRVVILKKFYVFLQSVTTDLYIDDVSFKIAKANEVVYCFIIKEILRLAHCFPEVVLGGLDLKPPNGKILKKEDFLLPELAPLLKLHEFMQKLADKKSSAKAHKVKLGMIEPRFLSFVVACQDELTKGNSGIDYQFNVVRYFSAFMRILSNDFIINGEELDLILFDEDRWKVAYVTLLRLMINFSHRFPLIILEKIELLERVKLLKERDTLRDQLETKTRELQAKTSELKAKTLEAENNLRRSMGAGSANFTLSGYSPDALEFISNLRAKLTSQEAMSGELNCAFLDGFPCCTKRCAIGGSTIYT